MRNYKFAACFIFSLYVFGNGEDTFLFGKFPDDFRWGITTSAYRTGVIGNQNGNVLTCMIQKLTHFIPV